MAASTCGLDTRFQTGMVKPYVCDLPRRLVPTEAARAEANTEQFLVVDVAYLLSRLPATRNAAYRTQV